MATLVGLLHPGEMGSSVGACAAAGGADVCWAAHGRSAATRARAEREGLREVEDLCALLQDADVVLSVCPPGAAMALADEILRAGFTGTLVDANAINPKTARTIAERARRAGAKFVDGGLIGPPARQAGSTSLVLSGEGPGPTAIAALFEGTPLQAIVLPGEAGRASALKMAYAAYTKGHAALLLATRALARGEQVEEALLEQWARSHPHLAKASEATARGTGPKAWRFEAEMEEIAATFEGAGLPGGFHESAAEVYRRLARFRDRGDLELDEVIAALLRPAQPGEDA